MPRHAASEGNDHFALSPWLSRWRQLLPCRAVDHARTAADAGFTVNSPSAYCRRCGASMGRGGTTERGCALCIDQRIDWDSTTRLGAYRDQLDQWIIQMKFGGQWTWAQWFGRRLAEALDMRALDGKVVVCPVPMHWVAKWRRGYNQAEQIARVLAAARGWPWVNILRRPRHRPPQTSVPPSERERNVRGSFTACRLDLSGWHVVLVDDVKTSGATAGATARLLKMAGAESVHLAVVAVADAQGVHP